MFEGLTISYASSVIRKVKEYYPDADEEDLKLLTNYYFSNKGRIREVNGDFVFSYGFLARFIVKVIFNYLYLFFYSISKLLFPIEKCGEVVKVWADVNYDGWKGEIKNGKHSVLIFPFLYNPKRAIKTIYSLHTKGVSYRFYGYRYNFYLVSRFVFSRSLVNYLELEKKATLEFCEDIKKLRCRKLYVMDDVEPIAYYQNSTLMACDIAVNFMSHGIGRYSIYYCATNAYFFNESQMRFYIENGRFENGCLLYPPERAITELKEVSTVIVVSNITKNVSCSSIRYSMERELIKLAQEGRNINSYTLYIKYHPNAPSDYIDESMSINNLNSLAPSKTVFVSYGSTSYYDFERYGLTLLVSSEEINSEILFGENERYIDLLSIKNGFSDLHTRFNSAVE